MLYLSTEILTTNKRDGAYADFGLRKHGLDSYPVIRSFRMNSIYMFACHYCMAGCFGFVLFFFTSNIIQYLANADHLFLYKISQKVIEKYILLTKSPYHL